MSYRNEGPDGASSANSGTTMTLGALLLRILGEMSALATEDGPPPGAIVTARAIGPTPGEGDTRHVIIFLGGGGGFSSFGDFATSDGDFEQILARLAQLHQPQGPPPATKAALDALPMVPIDADDLAESPHCTICCESFCLGTEVCQLPCNHFFDRVCVMEWLTKHNTCPICRYELPVDDAEREQSRKERMAARGIDEDAFFAAHAHAQANHAHPHSTRLAKRKRKDRSLEAEGLSSVTAEDSEEGVLGIDSADDREPSVQRMKKRTTTRRGDKGKERADEPLEDEDPKEDDKQRKRKSKHHKWASSDDVIEQEGKRERKNKRSRRDAKRGEVEQHEEEHGGAGLDEASAVEERSGDERSEKAADKNKKKLRKEEKKKAKEEKKNAKKSSGSSTTKDDDNSEQERAEPVSSRMPRFFRRFLQRTRHEPL